MQKAKKRDVVPQDLFRLADLDKIDALSSDRIWQRLGDANLTQLPPGNRSSQRHRHLHQDEFVYVLAGELTLIEDSGETILHAGDSTALPKGTGNGHHMINRSDRTSFHLEIGSRRPEDLTNCSDIDMMSANSDGRFVHKDGSPYPGQ